MQTGQAGDGQVREGEVAPPPGAGLGIPPATPMTPSVLRLALILLGAACACEASAKVGADTPWITYVAEGMKTTGVVLGPGYDPNTVETESSGQKCVKLVGAGEYVEFSAAANANALVIRYSLPDAVEGGGRARVSIFMSMERRSGHSLLPPDIHGFTEDIPFRTSLPKANRATFTTSSESRA